MIKPELILPLLLMVATVGFAADFGLAQLPSREYLSSLPPSTVPSAVDRPVFTGWGDTDTGGTQGNGGTDDTGGYNDPSDAFVPDAMWLLIALTFLYGIMQRRKTGH